jgi:hypothetical protein
MFRRVPPRHPRGPCPGGARQPPREQACALPMDPPQHVAVGVDPAGLWPGDHHAAPDRLRDVEQHAARPHARPDEPVLVVAVSVAVAVEHDVGPEAPRRRSAHGGGRHHGDGGTGGVVERPGGAVERAPRAGDLGLGVTRVLVAPLGDLGARAERHRPAEPRRERIVVGGDRAVGQGDLDPAALAEDGAREQHLRRPPRGEPEAGGQVEDGVPAVAVHALPAHLHGVQALPLQGFDRVPPQLPDAHRAPVRWFHVER